MPKPFEKNGVCDNNSKSFFAVSLSMSELQTFANPLDLFTLWYREACAQEESYPEAMNLSTVSAEGKPSSRMVLMKDFSEEGITFYTNTQSRKGKEIGNNPFVALNFYWKSIKKQIRIEGKATPVDASTTDAYFQERLPESQLGAWASKQSEILSSMEEFEERISSYAEKFKNHIIPRPPHWSGYAVSLDTIEFWEEQPFRLHRRLVYKRLSDSWTTERIYP